MKTFAAAILFLLAFSSSNVAESRPSNSVEGTENESRSKRDDQLPDLIGSSTNVITVGKKDSQTAQTITQAIASSSSYSPPGHFDGGSHNFGTTNQQTQTNNRIMNWSGGNFHGGYNEVASTHYHTEGPITHTRNHATATASAHSNLESRSMRSAQAPSSSSFSHASSLASGSHDPERSNQPSSSSLSHASSFASGSHNPVTSNQPSSSSLSHASSFASGSHNPVRSNQPSSSSFSHASAFASGSHNPVRSNQPVITNNRHLTWTGGNFHGGYNEGESTHYHTEGPITHPSNYATATASAHSNLGFRSRRELPNLIKSKRSAQAYSKATATASANIPPPSGSNNRYLNWNGGNFHGGYNEGTSTHYHNEGPSTHPHNYATATASAHSNLGFRARRELSNLIKSKRSAQAYSKAIATASANAPSPSGTNNRYLNWHGGNFHGGYNEGASTHYHNAGPSPHTRNYAAATASASAHSSGWY